MQLDSIVRRDFLLIFTFPISKTKKMIKNYKHVIWDWNGTLLNDIALCVDIINGLLKSRNIKTLSHDDYRLIFTFPVKDYYKKAGLDFEKHSFEILGKQWMDVYEFRKDECSLFPGTHEVLTKISSMGIGQSVLSAYSHDTLVKIIEYYNLSRFFSHVSGLDNIYASSKLDIGKELITKIELSGDEIVLIGDTIHDYEVARDLGINSILIANGHQSKERLIECHTLVLDKISDLIGDSIN